MQFRETEWEAVGDDAWFDGWVDGAETVCGFEGSDLLDFVDEILGDWLVMFFKGGVEVEVVAPFALYVIAETDVIVDLL
jgi:hypothetical protein